MCPYFKTVQWSVIELLRIMLLFFLFVDTASCFLVVYWLLRIMVFFYLLTFQVVFLLYIEFCF